MNNSHCLNCQQKAPEKYCANCGQKTDTHRITFKHFISHDVLHGTFHIEKGIFFTAKQALIRPGQAALDYIQGKRKPYYNVFLLILLTIGLIIFLRHYYAELSYPEINRLENNDKTLNQASQSINNFFSQQSKAIIFLFVPLSALSSFLLFKKSRLNLSEHAIISGMILLGVLLLFALGSLLIYIDIWYPLSATVQKGAVSLLICIMTFYVIYGYYNAFGKIYSLLGFVLRMILFIAFLVIAFIIFLIITIGLATDWKFGEVTISPF